MAAWITAIVALITFLFGFYQYYTKRKHNKLFFYMYLKRIYDCFKCNHQILENIFADEEPARALRDIIEPYKNDLHYDTKNLLEAQKYEEICRDIFSESDIEKIHDYILSMSYFFNLVRTLINETSNETINLIDATLIKNDSEQIVIRFNIENNNYDLNLQSNNSEEIKKVFRIRLMI